MGELGICPVSNIDLNRNPVVLIIADLLAVRTYGKKSSEHLGQDLFKSLLKPLSFLLPSSALSDILSDAENTHNLTVFIKSWS